MSFIHHRSSRRSLLVGSAALTAVGVGSRIVAQESTPASSPALNPTLPTGGIEADGAWSFTDDRGVTATADATPARVVAHIGIAAALYDYGFTVSGYYGTARDADGAPMLVAGDLPLDEVESVGETGEVDIEKVVSLGTELFIGPNYGIGGGQTIWPVDEDALAQIGQTAQIVAIAYSDGTTVKRTIDSIASLAGALGADLDAPEIQASVTEFDTASDDFAAAVAAKPGLTAFFMSGSQTGYWIGGELADLNYFSSLGLQIAGGDTAAEQGWESIGTQACDLIFNDVREPNWWSTEQLTAEIPTFAVHPAVVAGQVGPWRNVYVASYRGYTPILEEVTGWLRDADEGIA